MPHLVFPQNITFVHYIDVIMLTGSSQLEVTMTFDSLITHMHFKGKLKGLYQGNFQDCCGLGQVEIIPYQVKIELLLATPAAKNEV